MSTTYDIGDAPRLIASFNDENGALADPTEVVFKYRKPDGNIIEAEHWTSGAPGADITRVSVGIFSAVVPLEQAGKYDWHWLGTGAVPAASESDADTALYVRTTNFP